MVSIGQAPGLARRLRSFEIMSAALRLPSLDEMVAKRVAALRRERRQPAARKLLAMAPLSAPAPRQSPGNAVALRAALTKGTLPT